MIDFFSIVSNENSVWRAGGFSVRTLTRKWLEWPICGQNLRTADERAQMQWMPAERLTKNHGHVPDIQAARRS